MLTLQDAAAGAGEPLSPRSRANSAKASAPDPSGGVPNMGCVTVIGPVKGVYHLGYQAEGSAIFYSINEFVSKELAEVTAWRMNSNRAKGIV
jgi:hypothetical protein